MGILNITPDSFYSSSRVRSEDEILKRAEKMLREGATFLDIGGYSSRPGAESISVEEEITRSITAIKLINEAFPEAIISIDTFRAPVARAAVEEGASIVNDISFGYSDQTMLATIAELQVPYIGMHMRGTPQTMATLTSYENLLKDVTQYFSERLRAAQHAGIKDIIIDPGFGFAKTTDQNFELLQHLDFLKITGRLILAGVSRKSMIWKTLHTSAAEALNGTTALHMVALQKGASILRVHDVKEANETIQLFLKLQSTTYVNTPLAD
jgi:dihydropteroate synthase